MVVTSKRDHSREGGKKGLFHRSGKVECGRITWMVRRQQDHN